MEKKSLTREIHHVQLISILVFTLFFLAISVVIYYDRTVSFQQERLLTLNQMMVARMTEKDLFAQVVDLQNHHQESELRQLLEPLVKEMVYAYPKGYIAGYFAVPLDRVVCGCSRTGTPNLDGRKLAPGDLGRKIWVIRQYRMVKSWSHFYRKLDIKCYYPIFYKKAVIGHTFASVTLPGLDVSLLKHFSNIIALLCLGVLIAWFCGTKAAKKISKNIQRLALVEPDKKFPPFDYKEFEKIAETNHKVFEDLMFTEKTKEELLTNFPWGFTIIDSNGTIVNINRNALDMLGLKREQVIRRGVSVLGRDFTVVLQAFHEKVALEKEVVVSLNEEVNKALLVNAFPVTLSSGESGTMACFIDNTDRRKMQMMIEHMNRISTVGEMISIIVHDIRNPLAAMKALAQLCYMKQDANYRLNCKKIDKLSDDINTYLSKILTFAGTGEEPPVACSIKEMFENVRVLLDGKFNRAQVTVEAWISEPVPLVMVNQLDFQYVLYTLLNKSMEALAGPGMIGFKADYENGRAQIAIFDNGNGLSGQELAKIWETQYGSKISGISMGLAMLKRLIEKYQGDIIVTSELGQGVVFTIVLPAMIQSAPPTTVVG